VLALLSPLLAKTGVKIGLGVAALVAVLGLVAGALWYVQSQRDEAFKAGEASVVTQVQTQTIVIQREIRRAEDNAPRSPAGVSKRLRDGTF
jgi:uncharacterized protein HemX